ncbi:MAG: thiopurine S-methyltransferase [Paraperlucidibaca sp.]
MDAEFWHERWQKQDIGFHRTHVHPQLATHFDTLSEAARQRVFVPLCGKSLDMLWLCQQGAAVVGCELSPLAIAAFAQEQGLTLTQTAHGEHTRHAQSGLSVWQGDYFTLAPEQINCTGFYDRAALVALPPAMRETYVAQLEHLVATNACGLLITFSYDSQRMSGPPFALTHAEVRALFQAHWQIDLLSCEDVISEHAGIQARGLDRFEESVWRLTRR